MGDVVANAAAAIGPLQRPDVMRFATDLGSAGLDLPRQTQIRRVKVDAQITGCQLQ